jgi:pilus assembly protein CpaE
VPASTILLVEYDAPSGEVIKRVLTGVGYTVDVAEDADSGVRMAVNHQLVVVDVIAGDRTAFDICREIRATPTMIAIPVLCISQSDEVEDRIKFLEAGADDVMAKPFDARELEARVEALLLRFQRSRDLSSVLGVDTGPVPVRRLVACFSPKGGVGTTTIAVNVAMTAARGNPERVVLIDLDRQFGQIATHLNLTVRQTLADVANDDSALREPELLRSYATRHESGLHIMAAPGSPELAELLGPGHVDRLLTTALAAYDTVVIDAGSLIDEVTMAVFERAEAVILTVYPEMAALKAMTSLLEYLSDAGSLGPKAMFVLNNMFAKDVVRMRDVENALGAKVAAELPYDPFLYLKAVNEGIPVVRGAPQSVAADRLTKLASVALGMDHVVPTIGVETKKPKRLGGLLRRA